MTAAQRRENRGGLTDQPGIEKAVELGSLHGRKAGAIWWGECDRVTIHADGTWSWVGRIAPPEPDLGDGPWYGSRGEMVAEMTGPYLNLHPEDERFEAIVDAYCGAFRAGVERAVHALSAFRADG